MVKIPICLVKWMQKVVVGKIKRKRKGGKKERGKMFRIKTVH